MASLARRPNNQWRARYREPSGREVARHFSTRAAAQRWLAEISADQLRGRYVHPQAGTITLADYYQQFAARQVWQHSTRRAMDHAIATCPLRTTPIGAITPANVETWVKAMVDRGLAPSTVRARLAALHSVLAAAVRDRRRHDNPCTGIRTPRPLQRARATRLPTPHQVRALINAAKGPVGLLIDLAAHAGLRLGELRAVRVGDVDLDAHRLTVRHQVRPQPGGGWQLAAPKYESLRTIALPAELVRHLRTHLNHFGLRFTPEAFVLPGPSGQPLHPTTIARQWLRAKQLANVDPALRLHDLRHYYASWLIAQGHTVIEVQHALGHAKASTTLDVYAHQWHQSATGEVSRPSFAVPPPAIREEG